MDGGAGAEGLRGQAKLRATEPAWLCVVTTPAAMNRG